MATNKFFNVSKSNIEQNLFESLVIESIQQNGIDVLYIPQEQYKVDEILGDAQGVVFDNAYQIEAYMPNGGNYEGDGNIATKFGFKLEQTTEIFISKKRFDELGTGFSRPREGDLIYVGDIDKPYASFTNHFFKINQTTWDTPDMIAGKHKVFRCICTTFTYSYEKFNTGIQAIDKMQVSNLEELAESINEAAAVKSKTLIVPTNNPFFDNTDPMRKKDPFGGM